MPDQKTIDEPTVGTSDPDATERRDYEADASDSDAPERDVVEPDAAERERPEQPVIDPDVAEPDAAESETARERADMVGVTEPSDGARPDPDAPMAPDVARNVDAAPDSRDAEAAQDADMATESTPDGAPTDPFGATQESGPDNAAELAPGEVPAPAPTTLWAGEDTEALRERWRELQSRFVDDPRGAAAAADDLIGEAVDSITRDLAEQRRQLGQWRAGGDFDTERLRVAVTGYRDFLDRVLSI